VSPQPQNGQAALDNSVSYKPTTFSRVGIDPKTEEIAVLDDTNEGTYHGHVETWKDLDNNQRNALQNKGFIDTRGRVIRRDSEGNIIGYGRNVIKGK
jgi:filamentous hemagglutinin